MQFKNVGLDFPPEPPSLHIPATPEIIVELFIIEVFSKYGLASPPDVPLFITPAPLYFDLLSVIVQLIMKGLLRFPVL